MSWKLVVEVNDIAFYIHNFHIQWNHQFMRYIENMGYHYKYVFISHGQKLNTVFWYSPVELTEKPIFRDLDNSEMLFQSEQRTHFDIIINFQNNIWKKSYCWNSRIFSPDEMVARIHNCQQWTRPRLILRLHHARKW